jgi:hypothetical protein
MAETNEVEITPLFPDVVELMEKTTVLVKQLQAWWPVKVLHVEVSPLGLGLKVDGVEQLNCVVTTWRLQIERSVQKRPLIRRASGIVSGIPVAVWAENDDS